MTFHNFSIGEAEIMLSLVQLEAPKGNCGIVARTQARIQTPFSHFHFA
jgi:hypothetical protein